MATRVTSCKSRAIIRSYQQPIAIASKSSLFDCYRATSAWHYQGIAQILSSSAGSRVVIFWLLAEESVRAEFV
jgi:hypothetical protein